jgi:hypothetical protein
MRLNKTNNDKQNKIKLSKQIRINKTNNNSCIIDGLFGSYAV